MEGSVLFNRHGANLIKELELLYPGPYIVYFYDKFPITKKYKYGFKLGVTTKFDKRKKQLSWEVGEKLSLPKVLFKTKDLLTAADFEREKALELGMPDNTDYIRDLYRCKCSHNEKTRRKRVASIDWVKLGKNSSKARKGYKYSEERNKKISDKLKGQYHKGMKEYNKKMSVPIIQYDMEGNKLNTFDSYNHASRLTGIHAVTIRTCMAKTKTFVCCGYSWKYA